MNFVSVNLIMDRLTRHPLLQDIPFETVVDYTVDFIRLVGMPPAFIEKSVIIPIKNYRGELPCDFYEVIQVRTAGNNEHKLSFRYSTDSFHMSENKNRMSDLTYKLQNSCIFTSGLRDGNIEMAYMAMPVDGDGCPMIPDNSSYLKALELYIKKEWLGIQFDLGKITPQVMQRADQEYCWQVGQCQTDLIRPTIDQMEAISNMWGKLLPDTYGNHKNGFIHTGTKEQLLKH